MVVACLVSIWFIGSAISAAGAIRQAMREVRLVAKGTPASAELADLVKSVAQRMRMACPNVRVVQHIASPMILCSMRPTLLWPKSLVIKEDQRIQAALVAHELAHIRRGDHLIVWIEILVGIVHWWNPVYRFLVRRLRESREMVCDALALQVDGHSRREYTEVLIRLTTDHSISLCAQPMVGVGTASVASLKRRFQMIFEPKANGRVSLAGLILVACLSVLTITGVAFSQPVEPQSTSSSTPSVVAEPNGSSLPSVPTFSAGAAAVTAALDVTGTSNADYPVQEIPLQTDNVKVRVRRDQQGHLIVEIDENGRTTQTRVNLTHGAAVAAHEGVGIAVPAARPNPGAALNNRVAPAARNAELPGVSSVRSASSGLSRRSDLPSDATAAADVTTPNHQYAVELAEIELQEKKLALEASEEESTLHPESRKHQRNVKLALLAVRRAELLLMRARAAASNTPEDEQTSR
jgi:YD repeat-containing protein